jgi:hypothetical protein
MGGSTHIGGPRVNNADDRKTIVCATRAAGILLSFEELAQNGHGLAMPPKYLRVPLPFGGTESAPFAL